MYLGVPDRVNNPNDATLNYNCLLADRVGFLRQVDADGPEHNAAAVE